MTFKSNAAATVLLVMLLHVTFLPVSEAAPTDVDVSIVDLTVGGRLIVNVSAQLTATVRNPSDLDALVTLNFTFGDGRPVAPDDAVGYQLWVPPDSNRTFTIGFVPPYERRGPVRLVALATANGDPDPTNNTFVRDDFIYNPGLALTFEKPTSLDVLPGSVNFLRYTVTNNGNAPDSPSMRFENNTGWRISGRNTALPPIPPAKSHVGVLFVRPENVSSESPLHLTLQANSSIESKVNASVTAPLLRVNETSISRLRAVSVTGPAEPVQAFPGDRLQVGLTVANVGHVPEIFLLNASNRTAATGWTLTLNRTEALENKSYPTETPPAGSMVVELNPGEKRALNLDIGRSKTSSESGLKVEVKAASWNAPLLASYDETYVSNATVEFVDAGPDIALSEIRVPDLIYHGDEVAIGFVASNHGRMTTPTTRLLAEIRDNLRSVEFVELEVPPLSEGNRTEVVWRIQALNLSGQYVVSGRIPPPVGDRVLGNEANSTAVHVRLPSIKLHTPETIEVVPGGHLVLQGTDGGIAVENGGDRAEEMILHLRSTESWLSADWFATVPAGGTYALPIDIDIPKFPGKQAVNASLVAEVANRARFNANASFFVRINDTEAPTIQVLSPKTASRVAIDVLFEVKIEDATGVANASLVIQAPDGSRVVRILGERPDSPGTYTVSYRPTTAGDYFLTFIAVDSSRHANIRSTNVTWVVSSNVYDGFRPVNFVDNGAVGPVVLRMAEVVEGTTRRAEFDAGGGFQALPFPYEISTVGWSDGAHLLRLRATSLDGQTWESSWSLRFDSRPPTFESVDIIPEPDGRLGLKARVLGASSVTARFETDDGPVEIALKSQGSGVFAATFAPPPSWRVIVLLAHDEVGNVATTSLDAPKNNSTPFPPAGVFFITAILAAFIPRRLKN